MKLSFKLVLSLVSLSLLGAGCVRNYARDGHPKIHNGPVQKTAPPVADKVFDQMTPDEKTTSQTVNGRKVEVHLGDLSLDEESKEISFDYDRFQIRIEAKAKLGNITADVRLFGIIDPKTGDAVLTPYGDKTSLEFRGHAMCLDQSEKGEYLCKQYFVDIYARTADGKLYKHQETYPKLNTPAARGETKKPELDALPEIPDDVNDELAPADEEEAESEDSFDLHGFQGLQPAEAEDLFKQSSPDSWNLPPKEEPAKKPAEEKKPEATKPAAQPAQPQPTTKPSGGAAPKPVATKPEATKPATTPAKPATQPAKPAEAPQPAAAPSQPTTKPSGGAPVTPVTPPPPQETEAQIAEELTVHAGIAADDSKEDNGKGFSLKVPLNIAGVSQAIGYPAAGRLVNASALDVNSNAYRIKYPAQHQYYGTKLLVEFIRRLGTLVKSYMPGYDLLIGDLSDKDGGVQWEGRKKKEHASHQSGLDADLSYLTKKNEPAQSIVTKGGSFLRKDLHIGEQWQIFKDTVASGRVSRFFVNTAVKVGFCRYAREVNEYSSQKDTLKHIMIEDGHTSHFHIRLRCPTDSPRCMTEGPIRQVGKDKEAGC